MAWEQQPRQSQSLPGPRIQGVPGLTHHPPPGFGGGSTPPCTTLGAGPEVQLPPSRSPRTELNTAPHLQAPAGPARSHLCPTGSGGSFCCSYVHSVYSEKANSPRNQTQRCPPSARHRSQAAGIERAARWQPVSAGRDLGGRSPDLPPSLREPRKEEDLEATPRCNAWRTSMGRSE